MLERSSDQTSQATDIWRKFRRNRQALLGSVVLLIIVLSVLLGPLVYTTPINKIDFVQSAHPPSWEHPFGTNDLGQDILARVLYGARISITVGIFSMLVAILLGTFIGAISGFYGKFVNLQYFIGNVRDYCTYRMREQVFFQFLKSRSGEARNQGSRIMIF